MTTKKQKQNCAKLADLLEDIPDNRFNMKDWVTSNHCGTVGCALGWAAMSNEFSCSYGVSIWDTYDSKRTWATSPESAREMFKKPSVCVEPVNIKSRETVGWHEFAYKDFGRSAYQYIFTCPDTYQRKAEVIAALRKLAGE